MIAPCEHRLDQTQAFHTEPELVPRILLLQRERR